MRTLLLPISLFLVVLAACGGAAAPSLAKPSGAPQTTAAAATAPAATAPAAGVPVDCAAIKTAAVQLISVQLLAQLNSPDAVASIKDKTIGNLDPDAFLAAMTTLHALDAYASPLGDPKEAIDAYEKAAKAAKVLLATEPVTQAAIDAYMQNVGTVQGFLGHQVAIAGAMDQAGC